MSRKTSQTARAPAYGAPKLSAFDVGHKGSNIGRSEGHSPRNCSAPKDAAGHVTATDTRAGGGAVESTSSGEQEDEEDGDNDKDKADDDGDEDQDPDVQAPSGCATSSTGRQAGHPFNLPESSEHHLAEKATDSTETTVQLDDSSSDEAYGAVDLISDSEGDGSDMDRVEERAIIDSEDKGVGSAPSGVRKGVDVGRARSPTESLADSWEGFDFCDGGFSDHQDFFDEQFNRTDFDGFSIEENDLLGNDDIFGDPSFLSPSLPSPRRVRFAEPLLENRFIDNRFSDGMPNFESNGALAVPSGLDPGGMRNSSDLEGLGEDLDTESGSSSGYESDYGETTDEDDVPASATARPQSLVRRPSTSTLETTSSSPTSNMAPRTQRCGPRMGSWCIDPTKPIAIVDSCGKKILVCPARRPKKPDRVFEHILGSASTSANTSPRTQMSSLATVPNKRIDHSELSSQGLISPTFGAPPAPHFGLATNGIFAEDTDDTGYLEDEALLYDDMDENDDDDNEGAIDIEDLIDFGDDGDDSELELTLEDSRPSSSSSIKIAPQNVGPPSTSQSLLAHLDNTVVTAFRQTQLPAPASLSPLSPLRKRKLSPPIGGLPKRRLLA